MSLAERHTNAWLAWAKQEDETFDWALRLFGANPKDFNHWPFEEVVVDMVDWEGTSLELKECNAGLSATPAMCEAAYAEGFDVIDIQERGKGSYRRYYPLATQRRHMLFLMEFHSERIGDDSQVPS